MATRKELNLQTELAAARALCGHQLEKIQRLKRTITSLENRIERLTDKIELLEYSRHVAGMKK